MRSNCTSASLSLAAGAAAVLPRSGTVSASGSSTSTYFCSEWINCSLRSSGAMVSSAISRSATTDFVRSRLTVSGEPDEMRRARCPASSTSSNRFSTLSMQSSTVTRAIRGSFSQVQEDRKGGLNTPNGPGNKGCIVISRERQPLPGSKVDRARGFSEENPRRDEKGGEKE